MTCDAPALRFHASGGLRLGDTTRLVRNLEHKLEWRHSGVQRNGFQVALDLREEREQNKPRSQDVRKLAGALAGRV